MMNDPNTSKKDKQKIRATLKQRGVYGNKQRGGKKVLKPKGGRVGRGGIGLSIAIFVTSTIERGYCKVGLEEACEGKIDKLLNQEEE